MRILVVSDTHGSDSDLRRAILAQPKAELVIHLGDGEEEFLRAKRSFPEKMFLGVRGNCDWGSDLPATGEYTVDGVKDVYKRQFPTRTSGKSSKESWIRWPLLPLAS